uniref:3-isopropylmalate dehydrogenase n=1 Tax=Fibrocapsa japonica TaxID=94617 RepID=A0A7S2V5A5_9STRA
MAFSSYWLQSAIFLLLFSGGKCFHSLVPVQVRGRQRSNVALKMAVEKKDSYSVTLLPGDGIGPEIISAALKVLDAVQETCKFKISYEEALIGGAALDETSHPFPDESLETCKAADSVLLACIGGDKWDDLPRDKRPETGLLRMRKDLGLFANLRPAKVLNPLLSSSTLKPEVVSGVDVMVVRELTGGIYFGQPKGMTTDEATGEEMGYNTMVYKKSEVERIAKVAFEAAMKRGKNLCSVDKANVLDVSQFWRDTVINIAKDYPEVELTHMYVDNAAMQLIKRPRQFDVIVTGNMFGDILSDEASMLVGSLGMLPSASLGSGEGPGCFEPCHGSAPKYRGLDKANPCAMILSAAMMLRYDLARPEAADLIENAVSSVLDKGFRTPDIYEGGEEQTLIGCKQMGEEVAKAVVELSQY